MTVKEISYTYNEDKYQYVKLAKDSLIKNYIYQPIAFVHSYGCQQSVSDGERIKGILKDIGFQIGNDIEKADLILFNTCAVRDNAEQRVFGNIGALSHLKKKNPNLIIAISGCMTQQQEIANKIKKSFPFVDIVTGSNAVGSLPKLIYKKLSEGGHIFEDFGENVLNEVYEDVPVSRNDSVKAFVPVMYGCDNFCSYCIVPYVRGRERSRTPDQIIKEVSDLIDHGYKEIMLLGQNVNSYGKNLNESVTFADLLYKINALKGDFRIRFMSSHPKDCTPELIQAIASCDKVCNQLHLPVQSGSNRILKEMNRKYDIDYYKNLLKLARELVPNIAITSDILLGFPGETEEDFNDTINLVKEAKFFALYTFIYSKRPGTIAAKLNDPVTADIKSKRFQELLNTQEIIGRKYLDEMVGKTYRVLIEASSKKEGILSGRCENGAIVSIPGSLDLLGQYINIKITDSHNTSLDGLII